MGSISMLQGILCIGTRMVYPGNIPGDNLEAHLLMHHQGSPFNYKVLSILNSQINLSLFAEV